MSHRHENYNASDILKFLTGCYVMWFDADPWSRFSKHIMWYKLDKFDFKHTWTIDSVTILTCDMHEDDTFEVKCKKYLDRCFEIAQEHDIWGRTHSNKHPVHEVMKQGTCLESVLIEMDMCVT